MRRSWDKAIEAMTTVINRKYSLLSVYERDIEE